MRDPQDAAPRYAFGQQRWVPYVVSLTGMLGIAWAIRHIWVISGVFTHEITGRSADFAVVWAIAFVLFATQMVLAWMERPYTTTAKQDAELARLNVTVNVPLYNEEPDLVVRAVRSLFEQSRQPNKVEVVDDGSTIDYREVRAQCEAIAQQHPHVLFVWKRQDNQGKRHAQMETFRAGNDNCDIAVTVDSDTVLDYRAIEEGIKPFADPEVMSVAGLYLGLNATENWITRIGELICVSWQLVGRSALSTVKNVIVNSGAFAVYRGWILRDHENVYLNETFFGRRVVFSDDAHLAMISTAYGKTVQQPTAGAFTLYPTEFAQYCRQYVRWMRGAAIRAFWRIRHLPLTNWAWWNEFLSWVQFIIASFVFVTLYFVWPLVDQRIWWLSIIIPLILGYVVCARYLLIRRTDMSYAQSFGIFMLAPAMILWSWLVCRPIRLYALVTPMKQKWGTRPGAATGVDADVEYVGRRRAADELLNSRTVALPAIRYTPTGRWAATAEVTTRDLVAAGEAPRAPLG